MPDVIRQFAVEPEIADRVAAVLSERVRVSFVRSTRPWWWGWWRDVVFTVRGPDWVLDQVAPEIDALSDEWHEDHRI